MKNLLIIFALLIASCASETPKPLVKKGDMSMKGGAATVRKPHPKKKDDPKTTNNESNDQPIGHYGTMTVYVHNQSSQNSYYLDADVEEFELERLYFPKGGWVDFRGCLLDEEYIGECEDENGVFWDISGQKTQH
ncbi:MAG: hypothetical protein KF855_03155 [Acidobacteria bacterium]|nr:hypothetical protein [Acidobacteriota bacterium]